MSQKYLVTVIGDHLINAPKIRCLHCYELMKNMSRIFFARLRYYDLCSNFISRLFAPKHAITFTDLFRHV